MKQSSIKTDEQYESSHKLFLRDWVSQQICKVKMLFIGQMFLADENSKLENIHVSEIQTC